MSDYALVDANGEYLHDYASPAEFLHGLENYMASGPPAECAAIYKNNRADIGRIAASKTYAAEIDRINALAYPRKK